VPKTCPNCGKAVPEFHNSCGDWDCAVDVARKAGGKVIAPNGLPIRAIQQDSTMLEHEHADHPTYKFPVEVRFYKTAQERFDEGEAWVDGEGNESPMPLEILESTGVETHALIYTDGSIALTLYECCYALWSLRDGSLVGGSLWEKGQWSLTEESLQKVKNLKT